MIGSLDGTIDYLGLDYLVINVHGVGYKVFAPIGVLEKNSKIGEQVKLFTYTHVREDVLSLFGFLTLEDLKIFELLITVSGVGPKTALSVLSAGGAGEIKTAISAADTGFFESVSGLGKKNSAKIIIELKGKIGSFEGELLDKNLLEGNSDVVSGLLSLGYSRGEIRGVLRELKSGLTAEEKMVQALRIMGR